MTKEVKEKDLDTRSYDLRTLERNLKRGVISKKDYEKYLKALPDAKDKAAPVGSAPDFDDAGNDDD